MRIGAAAGPGEGDRRSRRTRPGRADSDAGRTGLLDVLTLELGFVRVRWFGIALALYLIQAARTGPEPRPSVASSVASVVVVGVFGIMNLAIRAGARRATEPRAAARVGMAAFGADIWVLLSLVWLSSYDPEAPAWAVLYILPLEGAIRYQMVGALGTVILMVMSEVLREFYLAARFAGHAVVGAELAFRFGIGAIIALIAGIIAQALKQEAARATDRARLAEEAARRLEASRRELALQHSAVLAGVAAMDLDESLQSMAESIGRDLGFDICVIQTLQGDELHVRGAHGLEESLRNRPVGLGRGITGIVAASRESLAVRDVSLFPGYIEVDPRIRAEIAVPLVVEDQVIGVLDVESADPGIVGPGTLDVLERLGDHIALVVRMGQLLEDRRRTAERLRELDEMKSDFVAITSHELRSPLTAIRGFARTLVDNRARLEPQVVDEFLEGIDRRSGQLSRLLDNLLLVSGIEDSGGPVSSQVVDPAAFLDAVIDQVPEEDGGRERVIIEAEGGSVRIDPARLGLVLQNLVLNALKFSAPPDAVVVRMASSPGHVTVDVVDRGIGIPTEDLATIFDRFRQVGRALRREREGVGIGLYIARRLAEAMGGTIEVSSVVGEGSTFRVVVPQLPVEPEDPAGVSSGTT